MKTRTLLFSALTVLTILSSCTMNQKILYSTKNIPTIQDKKLSTLVIDIEEFTDRRKDNPENEILFTNSKQISVDGKSKCINSEKKLQKRTGYTTTNTNAC